MNGRCIKIFCTLIMFIVFAGCGKTYNNDADTLAMEPNADWVAIPPEFASRSIEKTGGLNAWGKVTKLQLDCVVTFYEADTGYYLTEQSYDVYPWSNAIVISGKESNSSYEWRLSKGQLNMPGYNGQLNNLMTKMDNIYFAEAVLSLVSAPALFLDKSVVFTRGTSAINMQGRWCYPITKNQALRDASNTTFDRTVFYQNRDSLLVDMNLLSSQENDISFLVCGYDYDEIMDGEVVIPGRIEIYQSDKNGITQRRLVKIDIHSSRQI